MTSTQTEAVPVDIEFLDFERRWQEARHYVVSPSDRSKLELHSDCLLDAGRREFPVMDGVPLLIPDLLRLLSDHYAICVEAGAPPAKVLARQLGQAETIEGYLLGRKLVLSALEPVAPKELLQPGTIELSENELLMHCASGCYRANSLSYRAWIGPKEVDNPRLTLQFLRSKGPFFLHEEAFPSAKIITLYELLPTYGWQDRQGQSASPHLRERRQADRTHAANAQVTRPAPALPTSVDPSDDRFMFNANALFFRSIFARFDLDVTNRAVLDIGGGDGFLGASMEFAGARHPVSTDIRRPTIRGFNAVYPECPNLLLGFADMFEWCYADDAFSLIAVRNNSAVCFAADLLRPDLLGFLGNCRRSLTSHGLLYLTVITGENGVVDAAGLANRPLTEYLTWFEKADLHVLQLAKLGTEVAFYCCKREAAAHFEEKLRAGRERDRTKALKDYLTGRDDPVVLRNFFLAVTDFAGEVALEAHRRTATAIGLFGTGPFAYYLWRTFYISYYHLFERIHLIPWVPGRSSEAIGFRWRLAGLIQRLSPFGLDRLRKVSTGDNARQKLGIRPLEVLADHFAYTTEAKAVTTAPELLRYVRTMDGAKETAEETVHHPSRGWTFPLVTGDHDIVLPGPIAETYFSGRVLGLSPKHRADATANLDFEASLADFPLGYRNEQPR